MFSKAPSWEDFHPHTEMCQQTPGRHFWEVQPARSYRQLNWWYLVRHTGVCLRPLFQGKKDLVFWRPWCITVFLILLSHQLGNWVSQWSKKSGFSRRRKHTCQRKWWFFAGPRITLLGTCAGPLKILKCNNLWGKRIWKRIDLDLVTLLM